MEYLKHFKERLAKLIFLEINKDVLAESLNLPALTSHPEALYLPLAPEYIAEHIEEDLTRNLPFGEFVKGMYFTLGADPQFNLSALYKTMLTALDPSTTMKGWVAKLLKDGKEEDALITLLGLYEAHGEGEVLLHSLSLLEELALSRPMYQDALKKYAEVAIGEGRKEGYLFQGSLLRLRNDTSGALHAFREYLRLGGEPTSDLSSEMEFLERKQHIQEAEGLLYDHPDKFLERMLPLLSREEDNPRLLLMIAIAYRLLQNHEKAIYYLNEALAVDDGYADVLNELGINFAALGDYKTAIGYFRALFENTRTIEILTNLITCYLNSGDLESARQHIEIAERMDGEDAILLEIKAHLRRQSALPKE